MLRSMMQVYIKDSEAALELYRRAFDAEVCCAYPHEDRKGYMHAELNIYGQILALSEAEEEPLSGNTMQFCLHMGDGAEDEVRRIWKILSNGDEDAVPPAPCEYSTCQFTLVDRFGVSWCVFV